MAVPLCGDVCCGSPVHYGLLRMSSFIRSMAVISDKQCNV